MGSLRSPIAPTRGGQNQREPTGGVGRPLLNETVVEEQSHKDEMRAALRGDFERLRERLGDDAVTTSATSATSPPTGSVSDAEIDGRTRTSWLERLFARD